MSPEVDEAVADEDIPAGWYPDPSSSRRSRERLWDGEEWTRWTRSAQDDRVDDPPAGWHPDPAREGSERLWTGSQWTDLRRDAIDVQPETGSEPEEGEWASPPRPEFGLDGWYPDEGQPGVQRYWDGEGWTDHERPAPEAPGPTPEPPPPTPGNAAPTAGDGGSTEDAGATMRTGIAGREHGSASDPVAQISELARLREAGALTDAESVDAKARLLRRI